MFKRSISPIRDVSEIPNMYAYAQKPNTVACQPIEDYEFISPQFLRCLCCGEQRCDIETFKHNGLPLGWNFEHCQKCRNSLTGKFDYRGIEIAWRSSPANREWKEKIILKIRDLSIEAFNSNDIPDMIVFDV